MEKLTIITANRFLLSFFISIANFAVFSQYWINGTVLSSTNEEPVPYAHVILSDSSDGTFTDYEGKFELRVNENVSQLIITHVGFERSIADLEGKYDLVFQITPIPTQLSDVKVVTDVDKKWKREFKIFKRELFGYNDLASSCKILNPWVIDFSREGRRFNATADEPIEISNEALGYFVQFRLNKFEKKGSDITLSWEPVDIRDLSANKETQKTFEAAREKAYTGSIFHFFKALFEGELLRNGFKAYLIGPDYFDIRGARNELMQETIIYHLSDVNSETDSLLIDFSGFLQVVYRDSRTGQVESSWLRCKDPAYLDENGFLYNASPFFLYGTFSHERLSHYPSLYEIKAYSIKDQD